VSGDAGLLAPVGSLRAHLADPLFRNAYALIGSTAVTTGLGLGYWVLAARVYTPADVGRGSALISVMLLLAGVAQLNLMPALTRFLPRAGAATGGLVARAYLLGAVVGVVVGGGFAAATAWRWPGSALGELLAGRAWLAPLFAVSVATWAVFTLQDSVLTGLRRAVWVPVDNAAYGVAKIVLLVALAAALPGLGVFVSWAVPAMVSIAVVTGIVFRRAVPAHVRETVAVAEPVDARRIRRFVAGDYAGALFELAATRLLPLVVVAQAGAEAAGYFYVVWVIGTAMELVLHNFGASLTVEGALSQERLAAMVASVARRAAVLLVPVTLVALAAAETVLRVFGAGYAANGAGLLRLLALALLPRLVVVLVLTVARVRGRIGQVVVLQAAFAVLVVGLSLALVGPLGITGVGVAYLVASVAVAAGVLPGVVALLRSAAAPAAARVP
jgi:O-antigen/teichoic acid export membrane protein